MTWPENRELSNYRNWISHFCPDTSVTIVALSTLPIHGLVLSELSQVQSSWAFTFWFHSSYACQAGGSQFLSSVLLQSSLEIFGRDVVIINLSRPSAFSAWSLYSQRDFSGSGLASFDGRDKKDIVAESGKSENEIRGRKCWKNHHGHDLKNTYSQVTFFKAEVNAKVVKLRLS